jgi:hypothetical protein
MNYGTKTDLATVTIITISPARMGQVCNPPYLTLEGGDARCDEDNTNENGHPVDEPGGEVS